MTNPNFKASANLQIAANIHCKKCKFDFYFDTELGINIVLYYPQNKDVNQFLDYVYNNIVPYYTTNFESLKHEIYRKANDFFLSRIGIHCWCPKCSRLENGVPYVPNWIKINEYKTI